MVTMTRAIQAFGHGFSAARNVVRPCEFVRLGKLWVVRDPHGARKPRTTEVIAHRLTAAETIAEIRAQGIGRHFVCAVHDMKADAAAVADDFKSHGYRLMRREPFFACVLATWKPGTPDPRVVKVTAGKREELVAGLIKARRLHEADLADRRTRIFVAVVDGQAVGVARSIAATPTESWVQGVWVAPKHRRQGLGAALMQAMLADDKRQGFKSSVLLSSHAGALLYPRVGYKQIGLLQLFCMKR